MLGYKGTPSRTVSWHRYAKIYGAEVGSGDKRYLLIFPDFFKETDWTAGMGTKPSSGSFDSNGEETIAYTKSNFAAMQTAGIVILPAAGEYYSGGNPKTWRYVGGCGEYWSSTTKDNNYTHCAHFLWFDVTDVMIIYKQKFSSVNSFSVRLVQNK